MRRERGELRDGGGLLVSLLVLRSAVREFDLCCLSASGDAVKCNDCDWLLQSRAWH